MSKGSKKILVGGGSFGTALGGAIAKAHPEHSVQILLHKPEYIQSWRATGGVPDFFKNLTPEQCRLPNNVSCSTVEEASELAPDLFISAYPVQETRNANKELLGLHPNLLQKADILVVSKGMEVGTRKLPCEIVEETASFVHNIRKRVCYLIGPNLARDLFEKLSEEESLMIANIGGNREACRRIIKVFLNSNLILRTTEARYGLELGGAIKNVHAIGAGMSSVLIPNYSTQASLASICTEEQENIIYSCDHAARKHNALRYGSRGDDMLSLVSGQTRNFQAGRVLVERYDEYAAGKSLSDLMESNGKKPVIEGELSARPLSEFAREHKVSAPILHLITKVLDREITPQQALEALRQKGLKWMEMENYSFWERCARIFRSSGRTEK